MNSKKLLTTMMLIVFIVSSFVPLLSVNAATDDTITLNSSLYKAVKAQLEAKGVYAIYNDSQYTLTISQDAINTITELNLSNNEISDLTGLDKFSKVTSLDLSANELSKDSNLGVLSSLNLKALDLSSNKISDVSAITNVKSIANVNLHNQKFEEVTIVDNSIVKEGTMNYEIELPQIVREFAKPMKSEWLEEDYKLGDGYSAIKFDWSTFNSNSDKVKLTIGNKEGQQYTGLATLKVKVSDVNNTLYNSEINLYIVIINENQRAISFKDKNLYKAVKAQLTEGQDINTELNTDKNLYEHAYDEQKILVINQDILINEITSLIVDNKKVKDLSGIEMFIGLEEGLDVSSNYIDTIDKIVELQAKKDEEETKLQERFKKAVSELKERVDKLNTLKEELKAVIKSYNDAVGKYNSYQKAENKENATENQLAQLEIIKEKAKRYIELTGITVEIFGENYSKPSDLDKLTEVQDKAINKMQEDVNATSGEIASASNKVNKKIKEIYKIYREVYKITSVITPELRNITDKELGNLKLEDAKKLLQAQVSKLSSVEKDLTTYEKELLAEKYKMDFSDETKTPVATYFDELLKDLEDEEEVVNYIAELKKLLELDFLITMENACLIGYNNGEIKCVEFPHGEYALKFEECEMAPDGRGPADGTICKIMSDCYGKHVTICSTVNLIQNDNDIEAIARRFTKASDADIAAYIVLPRLYNLDITENLIENIDKISALKELRKLYAGENEIVSINNVDWSAMNKLNTLNLSFNNISEIKVLEVLKNLKSLDLSKNLIKGSLDFTISDMKKLEAINFASNQIDDIEYLKSQFEFIAKDYGMTVTEFFNDNNIKKPDISFKFQDIAMEQVVEQTASTIKIELPAIFRQLEELQCDKTHFGISSLYGNVTSDGKYVMLDISKLGERIAEVTVLGNGIGSGTRCFINYEVVEQFDRTAPTVEFKTNGGSYELSEEEVKIGTVVKVTDNENVATVEYAWATSNVEKQDSYIKMSSVEEQEISINVAEEGTYYLWVKATDNRENVTEVCSEAFVVKAKDKTIEDINITINTNDGSSVKAVKAINDTSYVIVSADSTVSDVLKEVTLDTEDYKVVIKDAKGEKTVEKTAKIKTNEALVVEGLEEKTKCIIVVRGDLTGDGDTTMSDILKLNQYRNQKVDLTEAEILAGNVVDSDSEIKMNDILKLNEYRLNKINEL